MVRAADGRADPGSSSETESKGLHDVPIRSI
jgi:hypothetical protein